MSQSMIRKSDTGFPKRSCSNKKLKRDDDSTRTHSALGRLYGAGELASAAAVAEDRMGQLSQAKYAAALKTPLGDNILVLKSFSGSEELGQPALSSIETVSKTKVGHA